MKKTNLDLIVGVFLIFGFLSFAYISMMFGEFSVFSRANNYTILADFDSVSGLKKGAIVSIAGVNVGKVSKIALNGEEQAQVSINLPKDIKVTDDAIASVKTQGIIGDKYIRLSQGGSDIYLAEGEILSETESAIDLEEMVSKYIFGDI